MNYRHIYHAGNFADVFKHSLLVLLMKSLLRKDKPICYLDTHAGLGIYDLHAEAAKKTLEYQLGIGRVLDCAAAEIPAEVLPYLNIVKDLNNSNKKPINKTSIIGNELHYYPGSSFIVRSLLRSDDSMILMELHPDDVLLLKQTFVKDKQVAVHHLDGYQGLKAFLPPKERRGLVLIDPPFEQKNEFELILKGIDIALSRWPTGVYAIWYPIKDFTLVDNFRRSLSKVNIPYFIGEMLIDKPAQLKKFVGCGMAILNPPWQFDAVLNKVLPWLWRVLSSGQNGGIKIYSKV